MIKIAGVVATLGKTSIHFEDINIKENKVTFIKGRNGSGKTTLMRSIAGLIPYSGTIEIDGAVTYNNQEPVLFRRTVRENIYYPLKVRGLELSTFDEQILTYAKILHLVALLDKDATKLSSGEKMKVSIIRAIIFRPKYVLLDEPTTHLDFESIIELINLIKTLKSDLTFIIVSHNKQFIDALEEEVIVLGEKNVYR